MGRVIRIAKGGGRVRTVYAPTAAERDKIARYAPALISAAVGASAAVDATAGYPVAHCRPGRGVVTAARLHAGYRWTLTADLSDCYERIRCAQVYRVAGAVVSEAAYEAAAYARALGAPDDAVAPQGSPVAAAVAEVALAELDRSIIDWLGREAGCRRWVYTRYADDLAISADDRRLIDALRADLPAIAALLGHAIATAKVAMQGGGAHRRVLLGVSVGGADVRPSRDARRRLRAAWHGVGLALIDAWRAQAAGADLLSAWCCALAMLSANRARALGAWCDLRAPDPVRSALRLAERGAIGAARLVAGGR